MTEPISALGVSKALDTNLREMVALLVGLGDAESVPFCWLASKMDKGQKGGERQAGGRRKS